MARLSRPLAPVTEDFVGFLDEGSKQLSRLTVTPWEPDDRR